MLENLEYLALLAPPKKNQSRLTNNQATINHYETHIPLATLC